MRGSMAQAQSVGGNAAANRRVEVGNAPGLASWAGETTRPTWAAAPELVSVLAAPPGP